MQSGSHGQFLYSTHLDMISHAIYHPQKCIGFGFSDGEGCEHIWASLQKLISGLRVSGVRSHPLHCILLLMKRQYHRRLYVLDQQLAHLNRTSLLQLGKWWRKKNESLERKRSLASSAVRDSKMSPLGLRLQWSQQKYDITQKAPSMFCFNPYSPCMLTALNRRIQDHGDSIR